MAADLFETYAVTIVGTMVLGMILFSEPDQQTLMMFPLLIAGMCILSSLIGTFYVKLGESENIMGALYKGLLVTGVISTVLIFAIIYFFIGLEHVISDSTLFVITFDGMDLFICAIIGLLVTGLLVVITEYYTGTDYYPVKSVAQI